MTCFFVNHTCLHPPRHSRGLPSQAWAQALSGIHYWKYRFLLEACRKDVFFLWITLTSTHLVIPEIFYRESIHVDGFLLRTYRKDVFFLWITLTSTHLVIPEIFYRESMLINRFLPRTCRKDVFFVNHTYLHPPRHSRSLLSGIYAYQWIPARSMQERHFLWILFTFTLIIFKHHHIPA